MNRLEDEDGVDGPFERAMDRAMADDAKLRGKRAEKIIIDEPERQSIDRETVLRGVDMMAAELVNFLPLDDAKERARNIAQGLQDGVEDPVEAVRDALAGRLDALDFGMRTLAIARVARAWTSTVQTLAYRETEPAPMEGLDEIRPVPPFASPALTTAEETQLIRETVLREHGPVTPVDLCPVCGSSDHESEGEHARCSECGFVWDFTRITVLDPDELDDRQRALLAGADPDDCSTCGGSGGGDHPGIRCVACGGTGRRPMSSLDDEHDEAEYLADLAEDDYDEDDIPW